MRFMQHFIRILFSRVTRHSDEISEDNRYGVQPNKVLAAMIKHSEIVIYWKKMGV